MGPRIRHKFFLASVAMLALVAWHPLAAADEGALRLAYHRDATAATCPDAAEFRRAVAARLGYDPFGDAGPRRVEVTIGEASAGGFDGEVTLFDADGETQAQRRMSTGGDDCGELVTALALSTSIAIETWSLPGPTPRPAADPPPRSGQEVPPCVPSPSPAPPPAPEPAAAPPQPAADGHPVTPRATASVAAAFGATPTLVVPSVEAEAGLRWRALSVQIGGRVDLPSSSNAAVVLSRLHGTLRPCGHVGMFVGCGLLTLGATRSEQVSTGIRVTRFLASFGFRSGVEIPIYDALHLGLYGELTAPLTRTAYRVDGTEVWSTPPLQGALGGGPVAQF